MTPNKENILSRIRKHKKELTKKYPLKSIALFGSFAREEDHLDSDVDLLVDFSKPVGMEVVDLAQDLESILEARVDLVTYNAIKNRLLKVIEKELIYV